MPVLPDVGSRIVQPGRRVPSFSASSTILSAGRSLVEPVGLRSSSFAQRRTSGLGDSVGSPTSGVPPTEARRWSYRVMAWSGSASAARDRRQHDDLVTVAQLRVEAADEADVLVVDVHVHEAPQVAALDEPRLDAGMVGLQVVDQGAQAAALAADGLLTAGVRAQDGRDPDLDGHGCV